MDRILKETEMSFRQVHIIDGTVKETKRIKEWKRTEYKVKNK